MEKTILVLGFLEEEHSKHLVDQLGQRGYAAECLDLAQFPAQIGLSYQPNSVDANAACLSIDGRRISPRSIFWRWYREPIFTQVTQSSSDASQLAHNARSALRGFLKSQFVPMMNPADCFELHWNKPFQLRLFALNKVPVPETLISNEIDMIDAFLKRHRDGVIYKPVQGGFFTQHLNCEQLESLKPALVLQALTIQERIVGKPVRVYVLEDEMWGLSISSDRVDFREDQDHELTPIDIDDRLRAICRTVADCSNYVWTAIDLIKSSSGDYKVLEANPSPMFIGVEQSTGFPLTESIIRWLTR